jgi:2,5-diamino-6-(ribosylamino)-4(3H)-pyrimidinone 5'-phosphate reductase
MPRPFVWANCAVSLDGRLAYAGGRRARLSGPEDLKRVQEIRAGSQAILVGIGTIVADDPSLRVHWELLGRAPGPSPLRVVLDSRGRLESSARVLDGSQPTLIATAAGVTRRFPAGVEHFAAGEGRVDLDRLLEELARRGVRQLMVEGGGGVLASFLRGSLVDRLTVFVAPVVIGGTTAPSMVGGPDAAGAAKAVSLERQEARPIDGGWLLTYVPAGRNRDSAPL